MSWTGVLVGEGFEGTGTSAAHVNVVLGDEGSHVARTWVQALATPSAGHAPFQVVARPGLPVRPLTLFVNKATIVSDDHAAATWGGAQAGVAAGVLDAVRQGVVPADVAASAYLICAVWVDPSAGRAHQDVIFVNNRAAVLRALAEAGHHRPTVDDVLGDPEGVWNPFFRP